MFQRSLLLPCSCRGVGLKNVGTKLLLKCWYEGCPESMRLVWISREPVTWPRFNLAASQRRPYYASVNSHCPRGASYSAARHRWLSLCTVWPSQWHDRASRSVSSQQSACPFYSSRAGFFGKASHHAGLSAPLQLRFGSLWLLAFPKANIAFKREDICECDGHTVHKLSKQRLTADWLAPWENDCSQIQSKFSSDWLPRYIKAATNSRDIQTGRILSGQPSYVYTKLSSCTFLKTVICIVTAIRNWSIIWL